MDPRPDLCVGDVITLSIFKQHASPRKRCALGRGRSPQLGQLVPHLCWRELCERVRAERWTDAAALQSRLDEVTRVYQIGRSLGQAMAALKAGMAASGLCGPAACLR